MGKTALKVIALFAIFIGATGFTYGYLATTQTGGINPLIIVSLLPSLEEQQESGLVKTWYEDNNSISPLYETFGLWYTIGIDTINFTVNSGEWVYFFFSGCADLRPSTSFAIIEVRFEIDEILHLNPITYVNVVPNITTDCFVYIGLQYMNKTMSPGIHNVTVMHLCSNPLAGSNLYPRSLLVQTLIP